MHPVIFQSSFFTLHTIWLFFAISLVVFFYLLIKTATHNRLKIQFLSEHFFAIFLWSIAGARIVSVITNYQNYFYEISASTILSTLYFWDKGLSLWGALLGFSIYFYRLCLKNDQSFFKWLDSLVLPLIVAIGIWDLGAFFDGINYGNETSLPWGVNFDSPSIKYAVPIHPTQIYAFLYSGLLIGIIKLLEHNPKTKKLEKNGFIGLSGVALFSFLFFLENFVRGDDAWMILGIRLPQIIALIVFISTGIFMYLRYNEPGTKRSAVPNNKPHRAP